MMEKERVRAVKKETKVYVVVVGGWWVVGGGVVLFSR